MVLQLFTDVFEFGLELFLRGVRPGDLDAFDVLHDVLSELDVRVVADYDSGLDALLLVQGSLVVGLDHEPVIDFELLAELVSVWNLEVEDAEQVVFLHDGVLKDVVFGELRVGVSQRLLERNLGQRQLQTLTSSRPSRWSSLLRPARCRLELLPA